MTGARERKILHIDDDPLITTVVHDILQEQSYTVDSINDPRLALQKVMHSNYRVVLLDLEMPDINGLDLLRQIKAYDGGIQVIALTAVNSIDVVLKVMREGALACCFKPVHDQGPLIDAIDKAFWFIDQWWATLADLHQRRKEVPGLSVSDTTLSKG